MLLHLLHWWRCPRTVEAAAADYERNHLATGGRDWLVRFSLDDLPYGVLTDLTRIVGYRYGLLNRVIRPADEVWEAGWNCRLIRDGGGDARQAAMRSLSLVQAAARHQATDAAPGTLGEPK